MSTKQELYNQGLDFFGQGKMDEAIAKYDEAIQTDPNDGELYMAKSMAYQRLHDLDNALEAAKKAVEVNPQEALFHTNLSRCFQRKGMIPEAEDAMALANQMAMNR